MTGIHMLLAGGGSFGVINPIPVTSIGDSEIAPTNGNAQLALQSDGLITVVGNSSVAGSGWHDPSPITAIGDNFWCRLTVNSGTSPDSGSAVGSALQLNSTRNWQWNRTTVGTTTANCTLQIAADSGMTDIRGAVTFNVSVTKDNP